MTACETFFFLFFDFAWPWRCPPCTSFATRMRVCQPGGEQWIVQETDVFLDSIDRLYLSLLIDTGLNLPGCASTGLSEINDHWDTGRAAIGTNTGKIRAQDSFFSLHFVVLLFNKGHTFFFLTFSFLNFKQHRSLVDPLAGHRYRINATSRIPSLLYSTSLPWSPTSFLGLFFSLQQV